MLTKGETMKTIITIILVTILVGCGDIVPRATYEENPTPMDTICLEDCIARSENETFPGNWQGKMRYMCRALAMESLANDDTSKTICAQLNSNN